MRSSSLKRILLFIFVWLLFITYGCITTEKYVIPNDPQTRLCVSQCENAKLQCEQTVDMAYQNCLQQAEIEYQRCQASKVYNPYAICIKDTIGCEKDYSKCKERYKSCFVMCGGRIIQQ